MPGAYFTGGDHYGAEVLFLRAEAAAGGLTSEDAAALYLPGIKASLKQCGISEADVNTYPARPEIQFDATNFRRSIGEQKWIALFGQVPVRFIYPGTEQSLSGTNYKQAVARQGTDALTTRLWFDAY